jgi:hypothetical protein
MYCQEESARIWAPTDGPSMGAIPIMSISVESILAASSLWNRSRTMALPSTTPALAPKAWTTRPVINCTASVESAHPAAPTTKMIMPNSGGTLRPADVLILEMHGAEIAEG